MCSLLPSFFKVHWITMLYWHLGTGLVIMPTSCNICNCSCVSKDAVCVCVFFTPLATNLYYSSVSLDGNNIDETISSHLTNGRMWAYQFCLKEALNAGLRGIYSAPLSTKPYPLRNITREPCSHLPVVNIMIRVELRGKENTSSMKCHDDA